ncbi:MAG TPA: hypothetical protein VNN22_12745 [Verrucomicrobiae bacterium]|nr:hypothetical protein [Verrucomicrobiae bacterium]
MRVKYSLITLGVFAILAPFLYFLAVNAALKSHAKEDQIVLGSKLIQEAINDYTVKYGSPPMKLEQLVPEFIGSIPAFPEISKIDYHLSADGKEWTLDLYWTDRKNPLIYRRTNASLSSEDVKRRIDTENGCYVFNAR